MTPSPQQQTDEEADDDDAMVTCIFQMMTLKSEDYVCTFNAHPVLTWRWAYGSKHTIAAIVQC